MKPLEVAGSIESQSVKTTQRGGPHGSDAGKKLNGPKRHILVDTTGLVQSASGPCRSSDIDREGVQLLLEPLKGVFARLKKVWVDQADTGTGREWIEQEMGGEVEVVRHPRAHGESGSGQDWKSLQKG